MKVVILAGGLGSRLSEETSVRPKPMVEVGGKPILWHIMKIYATFGYTDFIVCLGYKGYIIKEYFANYFLHMSDVTFDLKSNVMKVHQNNSEPWTVTLVDTGDNSMTGGRLRRVRHHLDGQTFCFTYGDGVSDVNVADVVAFHQAKKATVTMTAVQPAGRFGAVDLSADGRVTGFLEKPQGDNAWINGGFFVAEPEAIDYIESDATTWENEPLTRLAAEGRLAAFAHQGFWHPMDTLRDKAYLEELWASRTAPWKVWA